MLIFQDGERGYLEGLASRYADLFSTHYGDVLSHLEDLRRRDWAEMSPRERVAVTPGTPPNNFSPVAGTPVSAGGYGLTSSQSQPIYVPGKYSVNSNKPNLRSNPRFSLKEKGKKKSSQKKRCDCRSVRFAKTSEVDEIHKRNRLKETDKKTQMKSDSIGHENIM